MQYDFDRIIDRHNTASAKWDALEERFGSKDLLSYWVADMEFKAPQPVIKALKERAEHGIFGYTIRPDSYYDAVINWMKEQHDWSINRDWINFSPGVVTSLSLIINGYTSPGDKVVIQPPVYYPFYEVVKNNQCRLLKNPLLEDKENRSYRLNFEQLWEQTADPRTKILLLCSPHNPVGRVWTEEELEKIGNICLENEVLVISDEIHEDIVFDEYQHTPFAKISPEFADNCITCTAPSKTFNLAGLKASNIIISNPEYRQLYRRMLSTFHLEKNTSFSVVAVEAAYNYGGEWLEQMLDYLQGNLDYLLHFIRDSLPGIEAFIPEGTYLVWLDFRKLGLDNEELKDLIVNKAGIALDHGFWFGKEGSGFERINIACPRSQLRKGLSKLQSALNSL